MLYSLLGVSEIIPELCAKDFDFLWRPAKSSGKDAESHAVEVVQVVNKIKGTDFLLQIHMSAALPDNAGENIAPVSYPSAMSRSESATISIPRL